jgi:ADP-ribosylglycohydrolase
MFFLRQPKSVEALYDVVSAGGDTDTNGSVAGSLLGALDGTAVFPAHLVEELEAVDRLVKTANRLCDLFGIE